MEGAARTAVGCSPDQSGDKSSDDEDRESGDANVDNPTSGSRLKRKKHRGSKRLRRAAAPKNSAERSDEGQAEKTRPVRRARTNADSPVLQRANSLRRSGRQQAKRKTASRMRPKSTESVSEQNDDDDGRRGGEGEGRRGGEGVVGRTSANANPQGVMARRCSPRHSNARSPLTCQSRCSSRTPAHCGAEPTRIHRKLSTVSGDLVDISSTEKEALSYINARNQETVAALSHSRTYMEDTFSRCLRLSCQSPGGATGRREADGPDRPADKRRPINLSTLSFDGVLEPNRGRSTCSTQTFSLKYSRTATEKYPVSVADMFVTNGVFDPVEYLIRNRVARGMGNPGADAANCSRAGSALLDNRTRDPLKPILKTCTQEKMLISPTKSKCVRFACPELEHEYC